MGYTAGMETLARAKLTKKYQATVPEEIRKALGLKAGDVVVYELVGSKVFVRRELPQDREYLEAISKTLSEWDSEEDQEAYGKL